MMKIEDSNMPLKRIIKITSVLSIFGVSFLSYGLYDWDSGATYRFVGAIQIFIAINFWIYRLFLRKAANNFQQKLLPKIDAIYEKVLKKILNIGTGLDGYIFILDLLLALSFYGFGKSIESQRTSIEFFPSEDPRQIIIFMQIEMAIREKAGVIAKKIEGNPLDPEHYYHLIDLGYNFMNGNQQEVGEGSENPETELGMASEMPNRAKITTSFRDFKYRQGFSSRDVRKEIQDALKDKYPGVSIAVEKNQSGPPVGYPINIELTGDDYSLLIKKAEEETACIGAPILIEELKIDVNKSRLINLINVDNEFPSVAIRLRDTFTKFNFWI